MIALIKKAFFLGLDCQMDKRLQNRATEEEPADVSQSHF